MKHFLKVQTKSNPHFMEYIAGVLSPEDAKRAFNNRLVLTALSENALQFDTFKDAEKYAHENDIIHLAHIVTED